ncbi:MAG: hypothetical protein K6D96_03900 [Acetatifactor sp.]|nr:hypothetical protein [Acetatifactor sp.]
MQILLEIPESYTERFDDMKFTDIISDVCDQIRTAETEGEIDLTFNDERYRFMKMLLTAFLNSRYADKKSIKIAKKKIKHNRRIGLCKGCIYDYKTAKVMTWRIGNRVFQIKRFKKEIKG